MRQIKTSSVILLLVLVLFVVLFVFFIYTFLHEGGHALAGFLFGQSLTEFNVNFWDFSAHTAMIGGELTEHQLAVQSAAGAGLPLLIWVLFISLVPRKASFTLETLKLTSSMAVINTLLAWIILPLLFAVGKAPSDDVTNFLLHSQMPPLLLTLISLVLYAGGWIIFLSKIDGLRNEFLLFRMTHRDEITNGTRKTIPVMASLMAFCVLVVVALNTSADKKSLNTFSPPQNFAPVAQIDLSTQAYSAKVLTQFVLDKPTYVGVFVAIRNIDTTYFDISIAGPAGYNSIVVHGEGYNAYQDGGLWEQSLPAGTYQIILASHQSPGTVSVYMKIR